MLEVKSIDLHYGAAQALRGVSLHGRAGKVTCVLAATASARPACSTRWPASIRVSQGSIAMGTSADITRLKPYERARRGIAYVPQGREIFPLLTVEENLKTGFAPLQARASATSRTTCSRCSRCSTTCCAGAAATSPAASSSSWRSAARW